MPSDVNMSDSDLDKQMVYLAYRDIFKDQLAKLRKRRKIRNIMEKHKDQLYYKQLADLMDLEKACRILGDLLIVRLFELDSAARATFLTLVSPGELGSDTGVIVQCVEDDGKSLNAPPSLGVLCSSDALVPNGASESAQSLDNIVLKENHRASNSLLELRQNLQRPYFK